MIRSALALGVTTVALLSGLPAQAQAQAPTPAWPQRPVRMLVSFPPGTPGDVTLRFINDRVTGVWQQPLVIENRPGAGGNIAAEAIASTAADGYNVLEGPDTIFTINPLVYSKLNFKAEQFVPVTSLVIFSQMLVCHPSVGVKTVAELNQLARSRSLNYASGGVGVPGHLVMEMYLKAAGIRMNHVPYKGPAPAAQDLLAGEVACAFLVTNAVAPHVKAGRLVGLAMSGRKRSVLVPEVPTMEEAGIAHFDATFAEMLYVPRGTPEAVQRRIQGDIAQALMMPETREKLRSIDAEPVGHSPEDAARRIREESARWAPIVRELGLKLD